MSRQKTTTKRRCENTKKKKKTGVNKECSFFSFLFVFNIKTPYKHIITFCFSGSREYSKEKNLLFDLYNLIKEHLSR